MLEICLLGCGGVVPLNERSLSSLFIRHEGRMILVDCGEGTQIPVKLAGWGFKAIDAICFTHYHADHIAGLPGLLLTIGNSGRTEPLRLFGPEGLNTVVECLTVIAPLLPYALELFELPGDATAGFAIGKVQVSSLPADHGIPCLAYTFAVERQGRFDAQRAQRAKIPLKFWKTLQNGETAADGESIYTPEMVLGAPRRGIKIGYCTDTRPTAAMPAFFEGCDLLLCEGMYGDEKLAEKAAQKGHMVFSQAAAIARDSKSRELWLTHFSPAMAAPEDYVSQARRVFANTLVGSDLMKKTISFGD